MSSLLRNNGVRLTFGIAFALVAGLILFVLLEGDGGATKRASQEYLESTQSFLSDIKVPSFDLGYKTKPDNGEDIAANVITCAVKNEDKQWGCEVRDAECCRFHRNCSEEMIKCTEWFCCEPGSAGSQQANAATQTDKSEESAVVNEADSQSETDGDNGTNTGGNDGVLNESASNDSPSVENSGDGNPSKETSSEDTVTGQTPPTAEDTQQWVRYTPNPVVVLWSPDARPAGESALPSKTPMMPMERFKDRLYTREQVEAIKERERNEPAKPLANDEKERGARLPEGYPSVNDPDYAAKCGQYHGGTRTKIEAYEYPEGNTTHEWGSPQPESKHAIVILLSGDEPARMAIALIQSLRNVNTCPGIDIVVALAGGGLGSQECKDAGIDIARCSGANPPSPGYVISDTYVNAILRLGVRVRFIPRFESRTAEIPGGPQTFWGMAFNKLGVLGWADYEKIMFLDADTLFFRNVDYLLFYPMYTGSMTQCCNGRDAMKPGGGLWIIEPSQNLVDLTSVFVNDHDRSQEDNLNVGLPDWHFGDMQVLAMMFAKYRPVQPYLAFPESVDTRQSFEAIKQLWTGGRREDTSKWKPMDSTLMLAGPWDLTIMPKNVDEAYWFRASTHDRNYFDDIADRLQLPEERGRVWHALNESFDWIAQQCHCVPEHDKGPDWFISVHLSCLSFGKPSGYKNINELRYAAAGNEPQIPECMRYYINLWADLYEQAMGEAIRKIWWQEENPADTYERRG